MEWIRFWAILALLSAGLYYLREIERNTTGALENTERILFRTQR